MRELVVLGTSSQVPTRERNHNGYLLLWDGEGLLFDPGEGTQRQLTHAGVAVHRIHRICLTHVHGDHCFGLPGVLSRMVLDGVEHPVHLHYPASGEDVVQALVSVVTGHLDLRRHPHGGPGEVAPGLEVRALHHRVETYGYRLAEPPGRTLVPDMLERAGIAGPDVGRLVRDGHVRGVDVAGVSVPRPGQRFALVMDTAPCPGAEDLAERADLLVAECTYARAESELARQYRHLTAGQAGALAASGRARTLVLSHFSSRYQYVGPLLLEARAAAPGAEVVAARDLDRFRLPRRRPVASSRPVR